MKLAFLTPNKLDDLNKEYTLYKLSWPLNYYDEQTDKKYRFKYLVITISGENEEKSKTLIFGSDEYGNILSKNELPGSMPGTRSHKEVLKEVGYKIFVKKKEKYVTKKNGHLAWLIVGFIFSFLGGILGLVFGMNYISNKYTTKTKIAGWIMLIISFIVTILTKDYLQKMT